MFLEEFLHGPVEIKAVFLVMETMSFIILDHVDHIRPCAAFDLTSAEDFAACWSLENLQPLWASENVRKGASYGAA